MFTDIEKNDPHASQPHARREQINILLIGSRTTNAEVFKTKLSMTEARPLVIWYSPHDRDALDFIHNRSPDIDMIFLDLSESAEYPKEYFLQLRKQIPDIPIIALTDRSDYELINFVMNNGAAETVSQWMIRSDPERLIRIVESCLARDMVSKKLHAQSEHARETADASSTERLEQVYEEDAVLLRDTQDADAFSLKASQDRDADELRRAQIIHASILRESQEKAAAAVKQINEKAKTDTRYYQGLLRLMGGDYSTENEMADSQISEDKDPQWHKAAELQREELQSAANLKSMEERAASSLKAEQGYDAAQLKRVQADRAVKLRESRHKPE